MTKWVIHEAVLQMDEYDRFEDAITKNNQQLVVYPDWLAPPDGDIVRCPVYHSIKYNNHRGVICNLDDLDTCRAYSRMESLLKRKWTSIKMGEFRKDPKPWMDLLNSTKIFIKVSRFGKFGGAHTIGLEDIEFYAKKYKINDDEIMILASPANFKKEYRVIVKDNMGLTACQYKSNGVMDEQTLDPEEERKVLQWVNTNAIPLNGCKSPVYVLDIGIIGDAIWAIVEMNSFSSSGFYKCDMDKIVKALINTY